MKPGKQAVRDSGSEPATPDLTPAEYRATVKQLFHEHNRALVDFLLTRVRSKAEAMDLAHVVPEEQRFRQRAEQVHPPLGGAPLPVVAHGGEAIVSFETTAADALGLRRWIPQIVRYTFPRSAQGRI